MSHQVQMAVFNPADYLLKVVLGDLLIELDMQSDRGKCELLVV